ncbi:SDR family NAD(P)-dependent oxidoreductase [Thermodesulfobacteriota bacterium]
MPETKSDKVAVYSTSALKGKVAIITGAGSGIGQGIAYGFSQVGADVVIADINGNAGKETAEKIHAAGGKALAIETDAINFEQVERMAEKTLAEFGKIDILVNNAGGGRGQDFPVVDTPEETYDRVLDGNLKSVFQCMKAIAPKMTKNGAIISIASRAGMGPTPFCAPYAAAKAGIINFTESMAVQLAPIRVNVIAPGLIITPGSARHGLFEEAVVRNRGILLGRGGRPDDIACTAIFLASDASQYITGTTISVAGGCTFGKQMLEQAQRAWQLSEKHYKKRD